jgi:NitT/TauT family transport system substrate-binding protein
MRKNLNIRIGHLKIVDHLILGYSVFRLQSNCDGDNGLGKATLENIPMNSWEQISDQLKQGNLHGAFITAPLAMNLFDAGLDISFLMFAHRSGSLIVKNRKNSLGKASGLKGKTILIPHELSVQHMLIHRFLASANLQLNYPDSEHSDIANNIVLAESTSPFLMPEMLENDEDGDIGAYIVAEPYGSQAIAAGVAERLCTSDSLWKDHPCCGLVMQTSLASSHGDILEKLVSHFFQSALELDTLKLNALKIDNIKDDNILDWAQNFLGQDRDIVKQSLLNSKVSFTPKKLVPDKEKLNMIQNYMTDTMGVMPRTINLDSFLNPAYALKAVSEI